MKRDNPTEEGKKKMKWKIKLITFFPLKKKETKNWKAYTVTVWSIVERKYRTVSPIHIMENKTTTNTHAFRILLQARLRRNSHTSNPPFTTTSILRNVTSEHMRCDGEPTWHRPGYNFLLSMSGGAMDISHGYQITYYKDIITFFFKYSHFIMV